MESQVRPFFVPAPAFLTSDGGSVTLTNDITFITTSASVKYVPPSPPGTLGSWVADPTLPTIAGWTWIKLLCMSG